MKKAEVGGKSTGKMSDQQQEMDAAAGSGSSSSSPSSRSHRPQHLNLALQHNYLDDPGTVLLPSFRDIRAKTLRALYGIQSGHHHPLQLFIDKSPKGSVDEAIRPLVDLLNAHPAYATLSSCSGRIALFDPSATSSTADLDAEAEADANNSNEDTSGAVDAEPSAPERDNATSSGKGSGRWALSERLDLPAVARVGLLHVDHGRAEEGALPNKVGHVLQHGLEEGDGLGVTGTGHGNADGHARGIPDVGVETLQQ